MLVLRVSRRWAAVVVVLLLAAAWLWWAGDRGPRPAEGTCGAGPETDDGTPAQTGTLQAQAGDGGPIEVRNPERLRIFIDRYTQSLTLYEGERPIARFPVAVGKENTPSPPGEWLVVHKDRGWGGGFGTRWLGLNVPWGIYGIHGTNKPWSIGTFASAGCIRMFNRDVERLWDVVPLRTPVTISGDLPEVSTRPVLEEGSSGKFVTVLQFRLRQAGFDYGAMDGRFGPATAGAVGNFQALFGFEATGALSRDQQALLWYPR
ncbi:MAG TPA: L,D-transpeptidase family protein [Bacillota bacterium]